MRSARLLICAALLCSTLGFAQTSPDLDQGIKPYGSYHGGDLDHISLTNGNLYFHADLLAYSQRGALAYPVVLQYNNENFNLVQQTCPPRTKNPPCPVYLVFAPPWQASRKQIGNTVTINVDSGPGIVANGPKTDTGYTLNGWPVYVQYYAVLTSDGSLRPLATTNSGTVTLDGSGFVGNSSVPLLDSKGTKYPSLVEDANGNQINFSTGTDTLGRQMPAFPGPTVPAATPPASTASLGACPALGYANQPITNAYLWSLPTGNGGTLNLTLCYAAVWVRTTAGYNSTAGIVISQNFTMLQSVVFPNGTYWAFQYDAADPNNTNSVGIGDLTKITFPTGGSIAYTWGGSFSGSLARSVITRTVDANDGTGPHTWNYGPGGQSYVNNNYTTYLTVTDPLGNDTLHFMTSLGGADNSFYETQTQYFQGSHTSGTLLKTVQTDYQYTRNQYDLQNYNVTNVFPIRVTTTLPNGLVSKVETDYDNALTYHGPLDGIQYNEQNCVDVGGPTPYCSYGPTQTMGSSNYTGSYGRPIATREYDWGQGAPGPLLRQTSTSYLWQSNSAYLSNNFMDLVAAHSVYDGAGNLVSATTYGYDETALQSSGITTQRNTSPVNGSVRGNLTTVSRWLNTSSNPVVTHTNWYDTGEVYQQIDPLGHATTHSYSANFAGAYRTQTCDALNHCVSGNYDFNTGLPTGFTDQNNNTSTYAYDNMWRMTAANFPDGGQTTFSYPSATEVGRTQKLTSSVNKQSSARFDGLGRPITSLLQTPSGTVQTDTTYDSLGRMSTVSNPYYQGSNHSTDATYGLITTLYDVLSRATQTTKQDGSIATVSYTGNCTTAADEAGHARKACSDALGRLTNVWEDPNGLNYETDYQYDTLGNLLRVDQKGSATGDSTQWRTRTFTYDSLSRLLTATNPESGTTTYTYDAAGNVLQKTDARNITISYQYDQLNRLTLKTPSDGSPIVNLTYDQTSVWGHALNNSIGRLTSEGIFPAWGQPYIQAALFSYDSMGRMLNEWECLPSGCPSSSTYQISGSYDLAGNLSSLQYPSGRVVTFGYNSGDQLDRVTFANFSGSGGGLNYWQVNDQNFYPNGTPKAWALGNSVTESTLLNNRLQLNQETVNGFTMYMGRAYSYGTAGANNGNISQAADQINSARTQSFTYDSLNRLATSAEAGGRWGLSFGYDAWGNRLHQTITAGSAFQMDEVVDANNRIHAPANCTAANAYCYDASGNMLNDGFHQYAYNAESQVASGDKGAATYQYSSSGDRIRKNTAAGATEYVHFGGNVIAEKNVTTGYWSDYIFASGRRIARQDMNLSLVQMHGTCNNPNQGCRSAFWFRNSGLVGYRIQAGDKLYISQYVATTGAFAGPGITYRDANGNLTYGDTINNVFDQDGCPMNQDCSSFTGTSWHFRKMDLTPLAGMTVADDPIVETAYTTNANTTWDVYYMDYVLVSADGTVHPIFIGVPNNGSLSVTTWNQPGASGLSYSTNTNSNCPTCFFGVYYYHGDQIGSSRLLTSGGGWPVWQGTFLPYGEEYSPQITTNHYKFTGKERDSESNLDYFGARYYSSTLGRWISADWSSMPDPVPYADFADPQSLNLYSYVRNLPTSRVDKEGHCDGDCTEVKVSVSQDAPAQVLSGQVNGQTMTGVGTTTTITFRDSNNNPIPGLEVKENPVITNNLTGAVNTNPQFARKETVTTSPTGTIGDVVMKPVIDKPLPTDLPRREAERIVARAAAKVKVDETIQQNLTFTTRDANGQTSTCTATYSQSFANIGPNGKSNKPDSSGVNFKYDITTPVTVTRSDQP